MQKEDIEEMYRPKKTEAEFSASIVAEYQLKIMREILSKACENGKWKEEA